MGLDGAISLEYRKTLKHPFQSVIAEPLTVPDGRYLFDALVGKIANQENQKFFPKGSPKDFSQNVFEALHTKIISPKSSDIIKRSARYTEVKTHEQIVILSKENQIFKDKLGNLWVREYCIYSFVYLEEVTEALDFYNISLLDTSFEFQATIETMKILDQRFGDRSSRLIVVLV